MDIQGTLNRKVAGVPLYWILFVVAGVALYGAFKLPPKPDDTAPTDAAATDGTDTQGDLPDTSQPVFSATPVIFQPTGASIAGTPQQDTNELWGRRAVQYLTANGFTLDKASTAITKYLDGQTLSFSEGQARDKAVSIYGLPPEGLLGSSTSQPASATGPASRQGTPPVDHVVRNRNDDTPQELARVYYGSKLPNDVNTITAANPGYPIPYRAGTKVHIPVKHSPKWYRATSAHNTAYGIAKVNGISVNVLTALNPSMSFPVRKGTRVRVR